MKPKYEVQMHIHMPIGDTWMVIMEGTFSKISEARNFLNAHKKLFPMNIYRIVRWTGKVVK